MFDATSPFHSLASLERVVMGWLVLKAIVRPIPLTENEVENASAPIGADAARRENAVLNFMSTICKRDILLHPLASWILNLRIWWIDDARCSDLNHRSSKWKFESGEFEVES